MSIAGADEVSEILDRIKQWPPAERYALLQGVLRTFQSDRPATEVGEASPEAIVQAPTRGVPVERVIGLLKTDREPPSDEECRRIVEEERWKKYGP